MSVYLVDRYLPGVTREQFVPLQLAAAAMSRRYTLEGNPIHYIRTTFLPAEWHYMCLFEAADAKLVQEVNEAAAVPFTRIIEAFDLMPDEIANLEAGSSLV